MAEQCLKRRRKSLANDPVVEGQEPKAYEAPATAGSAGEGYEDVIDGRADPIPGRPREAGEGSKDEGERGGQSTIALEEEASEGNDQDHTQDVEPPQHDPHEDGQGGGEGDEIDVGDDEEPNPNADASAEGGIAAEGKKIARARSAWMLFLADNRDKVRKENPGLAVGPMQKILSEMWKGLDEEETARYNKLAEKDKERMKREMQAAGLSKLPTRTSAASSSAPGDATSLILPLARVRKTVRLDPSVRNISKEGLLAMTKATELFIAMMADKAWKIGRQTGRKSVNHCDVADFVFAASEMYWLRDEFREERSSVKKHKPHAGGKATTAAVAAAAAKKTATAVKGAGAITSFFQKA
ncbi:unnamed protein product [Ascophyllum nodosum]